MDVRRDRVVGAPLAAITRSIFLEAWRHDLRSSAVVARLSSSRS
jgi:predicted alpha/beta-hydrolase family hydrolase